MRLSISWRPCLSVRPSVRWSVRLLVCSFARLFVFSSACLFDHTRLTGKGFFVRVINRRAPIQDPFWGQRIQCVFYHVCVYLIHHLPGSSRLILTLAIVIDNSFTCIFTTTQEITQALSKISVGTIKDEKQIIRFIIQY